jgi:hypothetical protein
MPCGVYVCMNDNIFFLDRKDDPMTEAFWISPAHTLASAADSKDEWVFCDPLYGCLKGKIEFVAQSRPLQVVPILSMVQVSVCCRAELDDAIQIL